MFEAEKTLNFAKKRTIDRDIVAVLISLLLQNGFIIPQIGFKFDSIERKTEMVQSCFMFAATMFTDQPPRS